MAWALALNLAWNEAMINDQAANGWDYYQYSAAWFG